MSSSLPITRTVSDTRTVTRERVFRIITLRPDFQDALAQLLFAANQLHDERVTGQWQINFSQGTIISTKLVETVEKIKE